MNRNVSFMRMCAVAGGVLAFAGCSTDAGSSDTTRTADPTATTVTPPSTTSTATTATTPEPADTARVFKVAIADGQPQGGPTIWKVRRGEKVRFVITSDAAHELHLHEPFDIETEVEVGAPATISITAADTGSFEFEIEDTATLIGNLEVR